MPSIEKLCFFLLGDRARFPFKLRNSLLVTTSIVVADIGNKNSVKHIRTETNEIENSNQY